jgi:hypothetical protein
MKNEFVYPLFSNMQCLELRFVEDESYPLAQKSLPAAIAIF